MANPLEPMTLMTPGPVPLPPEVLEILARPMEHHRTPEFLALFKRVLENLKRVYQTRQPVFVQTSTGSGGMESALVNCVSPGETVIAVISGKFGERWAEIADIYGIHVVRIDVPWGRAVRAEQVEEALRREPRAAAVLCQACETSTAVLHPVREIARVVAKTDALFLVDAITALGALPVPMDEWGIDALIGGSQKAFMLPTGLSFLSLSEKAWKRAETAKAPRFYFDLRKERDANKNGESHFSSPVTHLRALDLVLDLFLAQGLDRVHARISALAQSTGLAAREMGVGVFAESPSPSVTALLVPDGIDGQKLRTEMEEHGRVVVMGGQDKLKGKIIRIGHMGAISDADQLKTLRAFAEGLDRLKPGTVGPAKTASALEIARSTLAATPAVLLKA